MTSLPTLRADKVLGLIFAAAAGDALGWPQEDRSQILGGQKSRDVEPTLRYRGWQRNGGTQFARYIDDVAAGAYSDDTQLMLAVARATLHGSEWLHWLTRVELPQWPIYQRGGGGAVLRAAKAWGDGRPPWLQSGSNSKAVNAYFGAGANGVAMRIAPHVVPCVNDIRALTERVLLDGIATHGHPRALIGGLLHAYVLRHSLSHGGTLGYGELVAVLLDAPHWRDPALLGDLAPPAWHDAFHDNDPEQSLPALWKRTVAETEELLTVARNALAHGAIANDQNTLRELGAVDSRVSGAGHVSSVAAAYIAARTATRPTGGLLRSAFLGKADTDTLSSMTGSVLGALHGDGWMRTSLYGVQDAAYLKRLAKQLTQPVPHASQDPDSEAEPSPSTRAVTTKLVREWTRRLFEKGTNKSLPDGRAFRVASFEALPTKSKSFVTRALGVTDDGQSFIIDRVSKQPSPLAHSNRGAGTAHRSATSPGVGTGATAEVDRGQPDVRDRAEDSSSTQQTASTTSNPPQVGRLVSVEMTIMNPGAYVSLFERVLGARCERQGDRVLVGGFVILRAADDQGTVTRDLRLTWVVSDLASVELAVRRQHPNFRVAVSTDARSLWIRDGVGNQIHVTPAPESSSSPAPEAPHRANRGDGMQSHPRDHELN